MQHLQAESESSLGVNQQAVKLALGLHSFPFKRLLGLLSWFGLYSPSVFINNPLCLPIFLKYFQEREGRKLWEYCGLLSALISPVISSV